jgi:hypothetical protein
LSFPLGGNPSEPLFGKEGKGRFYRNIFLKNPPQRRKIKR